MYYKTCQAFENMREMKKVRAAVFSTFLECSQISRVSYHGVHMASASSFAL